MKSHENWIIGLQIIVIVLLVLQMIFIWHIDLAIGAIWAGNMLTNGFARYDPMIIYHLSLYGVIIITIILTIMLISQFYRVKVKA